MTIDWLPLDILRRLPIYNQDKFIFQQEHMYDTTRCSIYIFLKS